MTLPYERATTGKNAMAEIEKVLRGFGCNKFATGEDYETGEVFVQFEHRGRPIEVIVNAKGYAAAWLEEHPWTFRHKLTEQQHEAKALKIGTVAVYSCLRDWIKGQVTAIEIGFMDFDVAFLPHVRLPNGLRVIEEIRKQKLLPPPSNPNEC